METAASGRPSSRCHVPPPGTASSYFYDRGRDRWLCRGGTAITFDDEIDARQYWANLVNQRGDARVQRGVKLEDIFSQIQAGEVATLNLVLKADVNGSLEAVTESLRRLERETVKLAFVQRGVGGINENDIMIAATDRKARDMGETHYGHEIR